MILCKRHFNYYANALKTAIKRYLLTNSVGYVKFCNCQQSDTVYSMQHTVITMKPFWGVCGHALNR
jgi:hypothetical protein